MHYHIHKSWFLASKCSTFRGVYDSCAVLSFRSLSSGSGIGFVGLGNMGSSMALNLARGGHKVFVCDTDQDKVELVRSQEASIQSVATPSALLHSSLLAVITMLPSSPQVQAVYLGPEGLLAPSNKPRWPALFLDCTTGDPAVSKAVAARVQEASSSSSTYMDAPVSGGVLAARDAGLTFMVGGPPDAVERATPVLKLMGKKVFHCGPVGTGLAAKICNNLLLAISMIGVSEAMHLGVTLGLEPAALAGIINCSTGRCWSSDTYNPVPGVMPNVPASRDYQGGFGAALMSKDLGLALVAATQHKVAVPLGGLAQQIYQILCDQGLGGLDFGVVYKYLSAGKSVPGNKA